MCSAPSRLFHPAPLRAGETLTLSPEASHHALRVLRLTSGDPIELFDGEGRRASGALIDAHPKGARVQIEACPPGLPDSPLALGLAQALPGGDKMDWIIEKAVELGVTAIQPLASRRSVLRLDAARAEKRLAHWQRVAIAACMQCGRDRLPAIAPVCAIEAFLDGPPAALRPGQTPGAAARWMLSPGAGIGLTALPAPTETGLWLLVGPEGGLDDGEIARAQDRGWQSLQLGPRVLRTETAGMAAAAALQARYGDLGG